MLKPVKYAMIEKNGLRCMLCGKYFHYEQINFHHIKPKYASKREGKQPDDSYENGSLVCTSCHARIHSYDWKDKEYIAFMAIIRKNKK